MERKIKILIEYDGSAYHGWQFQTNGITIQEVLQNCIYKVVKKKTILHSSGRTDAGVHGDGCSLCYYFKNDRRRVYKSL
mgnify:CR=1 FL=1